MQRQRGRSEVCIHQLTMSQLETPSLMTSRCWSICHSAYDDRAAPAALRCSGPTDPFLASSCDLQRQVARLRSSVLGVPNQYLSSGRCQLDVVTAEAPRQKMGSNVLT